MLYRGEVYDELKKNNQDKSMTELTTLISHMWTDLEEAKKTVRFNYIRNTNPNMRRPNNNTRTVTRLGSKNSNWMKIKLKTLLKKRRKKGKGTRRDPRR
jgi:hypothetical protein